MGIGSRTEVWEHQQTTKRKHVPKHARTEIPERNSKHSSWRGPVGGTADLRMERVRRSVLMLSSQKTSKQKDEGEAEMWTLHQVSVSQPGSDRAPVKGYTTSKPVFKGFANPPETFLNLSGSVILRPPKTRRHHQEDNTLNSVWVFLLFLR